MLTFMLILLVVLVVIPNVMFCAGFWWTNLRTGHRPVIRERFGSVTWPVTRAFLTNGLSMVSMFAMIPFGFLERVKRPVVDPKSTKPPVIFVHGLIHNASAWAVYRRWFRKAGYGTQYFYTYNSVTMTVPEIVHGLAAYIREVADRHPGEKLVFMGHSLGGLSLRIALADPELSKLGAALVTLGAPHQGSFMAHFGLNRLSRSLKYRGPLYDRIEQLPDPALPKLSIYTLLDSIVVPNEGTRIRRPGWLEHPLGMVGHVDLLFCKPGAEKALEFIEGEVRNQ